eukprot:CAMPEP_0184865240 /NCGR_PEP_ID=MMETSP0580-20130426/17408_1 /TAXON_ID=1118495 /ORGANISM="Dactyliosolen fragilissimus" /LENGTH=248 /DNA_ID=CAMNT_0027364345 /DNA_START=137 /DNA_END=883 /DNA_ORIENTATION=-
MIGDSDIARWPKSLNPTIPTPEETLPNSKSQIQNHGKDGAFLQDDIIRQLRHGFELLNQNHGEDISASTMRSRHIVLIACAGENDLSKGKNVDSILESFQLFISALELEFKKIISKDCKSTSTPADLERLNSLKLIFFGPKLEPWLSDDISARKQYFKLNKGLMRACKRYSEEFSCSESRIPQFHFDVSYINCLTMFCGDTANEPGAVMGCRAIPQEMFFCNDGLHLNQAGYEIWKEVVDKQLLNLES